MNERQIQFRVGLFTLFALVAVGAMVFQFGDLREIWQHRYALAIHFETAPGVYPGTPVRRNGVGIGQVTDVVFDEQQGGVVVVAEIHSEHKLRKGAVPAITRSLLGDSSIEFSPGMSSEFLKPGTVLEGVAPVDPMEIVKNLEGTLNESLAQFNGAADEWTLVGKNINGLMDTNRGDLDTIVERTAESLHQFAVTMHKMQRSLDSTNAVVGDPKVQENLRTAMEGLPQLVNETRQSVAAIRRTVAAADQSMKNIESVTAPLAQRSTSIVTKLDRTLANLETLSGELADFAKLVNRDDGSLQQLARDPRLYRNLNDSAATLAILLKNLDPVIRDMRVFSDKVARHPELIGVGGALKPSSGLKDAPAQPVRQAGGQGRFRSSRE